MARAWKYFPVRGKAPALPGDWRSHSTDDEAQIDAWLAAGYGIALDCEASGVTVIDPDADKVTREPIGDAELSTLEAEHGSLPPTYTVNTPGGGRHLYFADDIGCPGRDLAAHINIRSRGGYVVFDDGQGGYHLARDLPLSPLPEWVRDRVAHRAAAVARSLEDLPLDLPVNLKRAEAMLATHAVAVEGAGGDNWTYQTIQKVLDLGLSAGGCLDAMLEWNERCSPPWDEDELQTKIENALAYRQNDVGAWAVASPAERFGAALDQMGVEAGGGGDIRKPAFYPYSEEEQDGFEPPKMLLADFLPERTLVMLYAQPGSYKSFLALDVGLSLASGVPSIWSEGGEPHEVVYIAGEGPRSVARLRRPAWRQHRGVTQAIPFHLVRTMPHCADREQIDAFVAEVKGRGIQPKVVVVDTLARFMLGMNENDVRDAQIAVAGLEVIRDKLGCAVLAIHHAGKEDSRGPRGSSALVGGFDTLHEAVAHKDSRAVAIHNRLQKDGEERTKPWLFQGRAVAGSLVFDPVSLEDYKKLTATVKQGGISVASILAVLQRVGRPMGTHALASEMYDGPKGEDAAVTVAMVSELRGQLDAAARKDPALAPYTHGRGNERIWQPPQLDS